ncbi:uncharacterized protein V1510DRAFT_370076 [Dipodascopsis tothii]|uniref:uncharacterized protein n=1 Tax=Dipodascopsis tothii TaxID=44089 RepID=UPI0034CF0D3B
MSYYDSATWQPNYQGPWDARGSVPILPVDESGAFGSQLEEVDRALDNLIKSGKFFPSRRDGAVPLLNPKAVHHPSPPLDPRAMQQLPGRPYGGLPTPENDIMRSQSSMGLNSFYQPQRFQQPAQSRSTEPDQILQMKRRLAAQRERELRNFHQEQQFNRAISPDSARKLFPQGVPAGFFADMPQGLTKEQRDSGVTSPSALSDEDRREFMARQHRTMYSSFSGNEPLMNLSAEEQNALRSSGPTPSAFSDHRGSSPRLAFDPFQQAQQGSKHSAAPGGHGSQGQAKNGLPQGPKQAPVQLTSGGSASTQSAQTSGSASPIGRPRSSSNGTSSPLSRSANFSLFDTNTTQQSSTSGSSPEHSPPRISLIRANTTSAVAPIGTRPMGFGSGAVGGRSMTSVIGSPFSFGTEIA